EIAALRGRPPVQPLAGPALADAVGAAAKARGLAVTVNSTGDGVQIRGNGDFDALVGWLGTLHGDQGLRVLRLEIQRAGSQASVDALLAGPAAP
ncbi:MAG TPA: type II secretion system protein GspM, partial [Rhodocyclaceae bacterium]|nr:type II secretion system protein GspM [Rhodocyclaceae bacterium]